MRTMETDNETVDQACESICELVIAIHDKEHNGKQEIKNVWHIVQQVKDRFLAAHKRELADEKRISDAVVQSLRDKKLEMAGEIAAKEAEVAALRALVKEMADVLNETKNYTCFGCTIRDCPGEHECRYTQKYCLLVAKAREVIGGAE